jgi:hypothetical protein
MTEKVHHPAHYGGDVKFEAIKIIDNWRLGFSAGNALKYIIRAPYKGVEVDDLRKALWYLRHAAQVDEGFVFNPVRLVRSWLARAKDPEQHIWVNEVCAYWQLDPRLAAAISLIRARAFDAAARSVLAVLEEKENAK